MPSIPFTKVHGLGNDFLVVDLRPGAPAASARRSPLDPAVARLLCDRHFGVGADGVLGILPGEHGDARMRVVNPDGSEAEMCGNGIRCVARLLYEGDPALRRPALRIDTGAGLLECEIEAEAGVVHAVTVDMGRPRLARAELPMTGPPREHAVRVALDIADRRFRVTAVSMGNPHAVCFVDDAREDLRALAEAWGPRIERDAAFPRRTNVEFAHVRGQPRGQQGQPPEIDLVVWERGAGLTLACGTGACATAVAACLEGRAPAGTPIPVRLPGGVLLITVAATSTGAVDTSRGVRMRGPATVLYRAEIDEGVLPSP